MFYASTYLECPYYGRTKRAQQLVSDTNADTTVAGIYNSHTYHYYKKLEYIWRLNSYVPTLCFRCVCAANDGRVYGTELTR